MWNTKNVRMCTRAHRVTNIVRARACVCCPLWFYDNNSWIFTPCKQLPHRTITRLTPPSPTFFFPFNPKIKTWSHCQNIFQNIYLCYGAHTHTIHGRSGINVLLKCYGWRIYFNTFFPGWGPGRELFIQWVKIYIFVVFFSCRNSITILQNTFD